MTPDEVNDNEAVVRAAIPDCFVSTRAGIGHLGGRRLYRIKVPGGEKISDDFSAESDAWKQVRKHHPTVKEYEKKLNEPVAASDTGKQVS